MPLYYTPVKMTVVRRNIVIFFLFLLKTLIAGTRSVLSKTKENSVLNSSLTI